MATRTHLAGLVALLFTGCVGQVGGGQGEGTGGGDGAPGVDAGLEPSPDLDGGEEPVEVVCTAAGCEGQVGAIHFYGFDSEEEATRVRDVLLALPASLTRDAGFDVTRDAVSQADCPDPSRTPLDDLPAHCGYAGVDQIGDRLLLKLRDTPMTIMPTRLAHVLTTFGARDWFLGHEAEVMAQHQEAWNRGCYACPADAQEDCTVLGDNYNNDSIRLMRDFTSSLTASFLGAEAWGGAGVRWIDRDQLTCSPSQREAWFQERIVNEAPARVESAALDVQALCGEAGTTVRFRLRATGAPAPVTVATVGNGAGRHIFYYDEASTQAPDVESFFMTYGFEQLHAWSTQPFALEFVDCGDS